MDKEEPVEHYGVTHVDVIRKLEAENRELHTACNNYKGMYVDKMAENKKLREALITLMDGVQGLPPLTAIQGTLTKEWEIAEEALKDGE